MKKVKIIKKIHNYKCRECDTGGARGTPTPRKQCKRCNGTGRFKDSTYYFVLTDKNGNKVAFDSDTLA